MYCTASALVFGQCTAVCPHIQLPTHPLSSSSTLALSLKQSPFLLVAAEAAEAAEAVVSALVLDVDADVVGA